MERERRRKERRRSKSNVRVYREIRVTEERGKREG